MNVSNKIDEMLEKQEIMLDMYLFIKGAKNRSGIPKRAFFSKMMKNDDGFYRYLKARKIKMFTTELQLLWARAFVFAQMRLK